MFKRDLQIDLEKWQMQPSRKPLALKLRTSAREIINKIGLKSDQFHITHPQISYWPEILATEVWLVPAKAQMPYKAVTADCAYWKPEIKGMLDVDVRTERLFFSTEKIGWWPESLVVYKWSVNGGVIEDGASTTKIVVRPSNGNKTGVTVKLKLDLIEDMCMIENTTMFETRFRPR